MRLVLDVMCGTLSTYLRMCGHDAAYALDREIEADDRILTIAREEDRTLVTRDVELARRAERAGDAILLRSRDVEDQLRELREAGVRVELADEPVRCGRCNGGLAEVPADADLPEYVPSDESEVWRCVECDQHFWQGSHWDRVEETLQGL